MKTFKQFYEQVNRHRFENLDDLIFGVMDLIYSAGDYEANLRPVSVVDYGIKETQQMIDDYLTGVGLTDTQPEWYQQRFDIYKQLDDDVVRSSKDPDNIPGEPDGEWKTEEEYKEEMEDHHELYARFRAMVLAAMHNKSWKEYTNEYSDDHILNSTRRQNDVWKASERMRDGFDQVDETKSAPAGHYFTKSGNLVKGSLGKDERERGATKSDPKDKQRSKVPPVSQVREGLWANINKKKKRGGKSARKGSKAYKAAKKAGDKLKATK